MDNPRRNVLVPDPKELSPGRFIYANMYWSVVNDAYIIYSFWQKGTFRLQAYTVTDPITAKLRCKDIRYNVRVRPASEFKGSEYGRFYIAVSESSSKKPLLGKNTLIEDPLRLMRGVQVPNDGSGILVGIRLNIDCSRRARFAVSHCFASS